MIDIRNQQAYFGSMANDTTSKTVTAGLTKDATAAIAKINSAIVKRREAEIEVGKAQADLAIVQARAVTDRAGLADALGSFREVAMHW